MQITTVLILVGLAGLLRVFARWRARRWLVFGVSILCLYVLQPGLAVRGLAYWLPTLTLALTIFCWLLTSAVGRRWTRENAAAGGLALALALLVALARCLDASWLLEIGSSTVARLPLERSSR